jgi:hypothetical protein
MLVILGVFWLLVSGTNADCANLLFDQTKTARQYFTGNGCMGVETCVFLNCNGGDEPGGAIRIGGSSTSASRVINCKFNNCRVNSGETGGAMFLRSEGQLTLTGNCGEQCSAGLCSFLYVDYHPYTAMSGCTVADCTSDGSRGAVRFLRRVGMTDTNFSKCYCPIDGTILDLGGTDSNAYTFSYAVAYKCSGKTLFRDDRGPTKWNMDHWLFLESAPTSCIFWGRIVTSGDAN